MRPDRLAVDRLRHLPAARALLLGLMEERDNAHAPLHGISQQIINLGSERIKVAERISAIFAAAGVPELRAAPDPSGANPFDRMMERRRAEVEADPALDIERRRLANIDEEIAELRGRNERLGERWRVLGQTVANLEKWLIDLPPDVTIRAAAALPQPALRKGEQISDAVEGRRRRVRELDADLQRIETAPVPSADAKRLAREQLDALAARGRPRCNSLIDHGEPIQWPSVRNLGPGARESSQDAIGLLAWAFREQLGAAIDAEIDAIADDGTALTPEQREEQCTVARRDKLAAQREEEAFVRMAIAAGTGIMRRPDCDPRAVLSLADDLPGYAPQW
jgi:hypothetical protein